MLDDLTRDFEKTFVKTKLLIKGAKISHFQSIERTFFAVFFFSDTSFVFVYCHNILDLPQELGIPIYDSSDCTVYRQLKA